MLQNYLSEGNPEKFSFVFMMVSQNTKSEAEPLPVHCFLDTNQHKPGTDFSTESKDVKSKKSYCRQCASLDRKGKNLLFKYRNEQDESLFSWRRKTKGTQVQSCGKDEKFVHVFEQRQVPTDREKRTLIKRS